MFIKPGTPRILFNYMRHQDDVEGFRACIRLTREIMGQKAMDPYRGEEIQPGAEKTDDESIDAWIRENAESAYHPSCTCKIGCRTCLQVRGRIVLGLR